MPLVPFKDMGAGLNLDGFPHELPAQQWSSGQNMRFRDGYAEKSQGDAQVHGTPLFPPYGLFPTQGVNGRFWVYAGLTSLGAVKEDTHTNITRAAGGYSATENDKWTGGVLSGVLIVNNGVDVPQYWGGDIAVKANDLPAWPSTLRTKVLRCFRNFVFAFNNSNGAVKLPYEVRWSQPADPGNLPTSYALNDPALDSGSFDLADTDDVIVDALPLGQQMIVYKENSIWALDYVGAPYIWASKPISKEFGCLAANCVTAFPGGHVGLSQGDVIRFDGSAARSIADDRTRRWLFNNLNAERYERSFVVPNFRRNEVWVCVPQVGSDWPDVALIWNWKDDTWGIRDLAQASCGAAGTIVYDIGNSWEGDPEPWESDDTAWNQYEYTKATPRLMIGSAVNVDLRLADVGKTFGGVPMRARLEKTGMSFGDPSILKFVRGVRLRLQANEGVQADVYVGSQDDLDGPIEWSQPCPFIVGQDLKADVTTTGRYIALAIETNGIVSWRLKQFDMDVVPMGGY